MATRKRILIRTQLTASGRWPRWTGFSKKTLWDWLQLFSALTIPIVVLSATLLFTAHQDTANKAQHDNDLKIAQDNRQNDLKIAEEQQQEATLKAYLDDMTTLLLDKKLGSQNQADKAASDETAIIARAKTLTALRRLTDPQRKTAVVLFLYEAHLIGYFSTINTSSKPVRQIIDLRGADLRGADLSYASLIGANLSGADLSDADLRVADLRVADLRGALIDGADLSDANLRGAQLSGARLVAHLIGADLRGADLRLATLDDANLSGANLGCIEQSDATVCADLRDAHLSGANLGCIKQFGAAVCADLRGADLRLANLYGVRYNTKTIQMHFAEGGSVTLQSTQWPQGFDPQAVWAICVDC